jgi:hypothetical protein
MFVLGSGFLSSDTFVFVFRRRNAHRRVNREVVGSVQVCFGNTFLDMFILVLGSVSFDTFGFDLFSNNKTLTDT